MTGINDWIKVSFFRFSRKFHIILKWGKWVIVWLKVNTIEFSQIYLLGFSEIVLEDRHSNVGKSDCLGI